MYCRNCGNVVADNATLCTSCGFNPADGNNFCPQCGHFCIPGDVECVQCKASLISAPKMSVTQSNYSAPQPQQSAPQPQATQAQTPVPPPPITTAQPQQQPQQQTKKVDTKVGPKFLTPDQRYCRNCGLVIPASATKCPFCDAAGGGNYCPKCGSGTMSGDTVCSVCSSPLTVRPNVGYIPSQPPIPTQNNAGQQNRQQYAPSTPQNNRQMYGSDMRDWLTTLLLCIFLGYFGVHRFYTKHYLSGIVQFLTGGGCCIWWVVDLIMILTDSYRDGDGNKLQRDI
ncbi:MAG: TM2 domain-containing protein [Bacteroidales bacterium]|nr:TM2 domain-containing protein [Bacteroidales bacterium]